MTMYQEEGLLEEVPLNILVTLHKHGWKAQLSLEEAEKLLEKKAPYHYLIRLDEQKDKFILTFVSSQGQIKNDTLVLIDWINGIFANGLPCHVGPLEELIPLKMNCDPSQAFPV